METLKNIVKELKTYNLVKNRKKLLEDRLEQFNKKQKPDEDIMPWKAGSLYDMKMENLLDAIDECHDTINKIDGWLENVDPLEKIIIEQRYFLGLSWADIADQAAYSLRMSERILNRGLEKIVLTIGGKDEA